MPAAASMRLTPPSPMFSFNVTLSSSSSVARSATASTPLAATSSASACASALNWSEPATKSVSLFSSTIAPTLPSRWSATTPCVASRSSRLALAARPFSRSQVLAASMSPSFSWSAFLQSIMPAPDESRSALTSCAVNDMELSSPGSRWWRHRACRRPARPPRLRSPRPLRPRPRPAHQRHRRLLRRRTRPPRRPAGPSRR